MDKNLSKTIASPICTILLEITDSLVREFPIYKIEDLKYCGLEHDSLIIIIGYTIIELIPEQTINRKLTICYLGSKETHMINSFEEIIILINQLKTDLILDKI